MTKADIVDRVAAGTGLTKLETEAIIEGFFKTVIDSLKDGRGIEIRGFGSYKVKKKNSRQARNPKTGERIGPVLLFECTSRIEVKSSDFSPSGFQVFRCGKGRNYKTKK